MVGIGIAGDSRKAICTRGATNHAGTVATWERWGEDMIEYSIIVEFWKFMLNMFIAVLTPIFVVIAAIYLVRKLWKGIRS